MCTVSWRISLLHQRPSFTRGFGKELTVIIIIHFFCLLRSHMIGRSYRLTCIQLSKSVVLPFNILSISSATENQCTTKASGRSDCDCHFDDECMEGFAFSCSASVIKKSWILSIWLQCFILNSEMGEWQLKIGFYKRTEWTLISSCFLPLPVRSLMEDNIFRQGETKETRLSTYLGKHPVAFGVLQLKRVLASFCVSCPSLSTRLSTSVHPSRGQSVEPTEDLL